MLAETEQKTLRWLIGSINTETKNVLSSMPEELREIYKKCFDIGVAAGANPSGEDIILV